MRTEPMTETASTPDRDHSPAVGAALRDLARAFATLVLSLWSVPRRRYRAYMDAEDLAEFDDARLRDIGLRRDQIADALRTGRVPPRP